MKNKFPLIVLGVALLAFATTLLPERKPGGFDLPTFGRLPVLADGRMKPLDTVARNSLLMLQNRQRVVTPSGKTLNPREWLLDVFFKPDQADTYAIFRIDNADVLSLFNLSPSDGVAGVRFTFKQLRPALPELNRQAQLVFPVEVPQRTVFQRAVLDVFSRLQLYDRLKFVMQAPDTPGYDLLFSSKEQLAMGRSVFETMNTYSLLRVVPPASGDTREFGTTGASLLASIASGQVDPAVQNFRELGAAWNRGDVAAFNAAVEKSAERIATDFPALVTKSNLEVLFNRIAPFYFSTGLYVAAFLLAVAAWLKWPEILGQASFWLMIFAFVLTTFGIAVRMWLEGRPPVTNLYSSALFVGWGAVALCLILEWLDRRAVAGAAGALVGFSTLVIAHHLSLSGDTMEMMRAVLDSNFWLATHVITITVGYSATFLAGFLAMVYILRGVFTRSLDGPTANGLAKMVYGVVCFATLFSFIGTVLGGIWADQSWGRFWGWDPKENGALIIVIWNAVILHCRWAGMVKQRGLMALAVFGNVVTAWSWFGTNMLGVGLHSYGFTDAAFLGLLAFVVSQAVFVALVILPLPAWRRQALQK